MNRVIALMVGYSPSLFFLMLIPLFLRPEMTLCFSSSGRGVSSGTYTHLLFSSSATSVSRSHEIERLEISSSFHEKLYNRCSGHTTPVAPAAPPRHRAFLAAAPSAGAPPDAR